MDLDTIDFSELFEKTAGDIKPGLERIKRAFEYLGSPSKKIPTVLVAGTNGKGSTAGMLWSMLSAAGYRVGLYSSPHLRFFSERYQISDIEITDSDVFSEFKNLKSKLPLDIYNDLSFFEIATLISFMMFEKAQCDYQVIEVGLGGRLDATNILDPILSVIVSLSVDHVEFLGSDLKGIAFEKMGIAREGRDILWGASGEYMELEDADKHIVEISPKDSRLWDFSKYVAIDDESFQLDSKKYKFPEALINAPIFIKRNFILSYKAFKSLIDDCEPSSLFSKTFSNTRAPVTLVGRSQSIEVDYKGEKLEIYFDVGHNPNGISEMIKTAKRRSVTDYPVLASVLRDKDYNRVFEILEDSFDELFIFKMEHPRAMSKELLSNEMQKKFFSSFKELLDHMISKTDHRKFVLTGSVLVIGDVMSQLDILPSQFKMSDIFLISYALVIITLLKSGIF